MGTRWRFPQPTSNLSTRWCSSSLKIDVCAIALRNDPRFENSKTLFVSGERAEESPNRAKYPPVEIHRADPRKSRKSGSKGRVSRHIDHWRPVLHWREDQVWEIIRKFRVNPHPKELVRGGDDILNKNKSKNLATTDQSDGLVEITTMLKVHIQNQIIQGANLLEDTGVGDTGVELFVARIAPKGNGNFSKKPGLEVIERWFGFNWH
ncbi:phosphoadenosine phosphosulfate reductase domain-containing protein [Coleofasciculus sp.]|uniref:phosphoadenosine phosphosulfate reductase domain-containing protein n=1 Tax=Coleofasciculus sp. TaxID=3100458 RepID=UPI0039F93B9E